MLEIRTFRSSLSRKQIALIISLQGSLAGEDTQKLDQKILEFFNTGYRFLVMDCKDVEKIDDYGRRSLLHAVETFQQQGGIVLLIRVNAEITSFFDSLGFSPIFTFFTTEDEALEFLDNQIKQMFPDDVTTTPMPQPQQPKPKIPMQKQVKETKKLPQVSVKQAPAKSTQKYQEVTSKMSVQKEPLALNIEISYYDRMSTTAVFPLKLKFSSRKPVEDSLNIIPNFPGCIVTPQFKALGDLKATNEATFWITPLVNAKLESWIEVWKGEHAVHNINMPTVTNSQKWSKWSFISCLIFLFFPTLISSISQIQSLANALPILQNSTATQGTSGLFLLISIFCFLRNRPHKEIRELAVIM